VKHIEITPEPTPEERQAIESALAESQETPAPWREEEEEP